METRKRHFNSFSLEEKLDNFPPFLCWLLARRRRPAMPESVVRQRFARRQRGEDLSKIPGSIRLNRDEVARVSGLNYRQVSRIATKVSWDDVTVKDMLAFMNGCGLELNHLDFQRKFLKSILKNRRGFSYLRAAEYQKLIGQMERHKAYLLSKRTSASIRAKVHSPPLAGTPSGPSMVSS